MRETRVAQASIFENYSEHEFGVRLKALSNRLDQHPEILFLVAKYLVDESVAKVGRMGLSAESIFRCLLLKQQLRISYEQLANNLTPRRSGLQSTIRSIKPETSEKAHEALSGNWLQGLCLVFSSQL